MALRAVPDHPKFAVLKSKLKCGRGEALGYLEALWHFTGRFTPQGNIGKYTDAQIEGWIEWKGEPGALVGALSSSGWLLAHPVYRLYAWQWGRWSGLSKRSRRWMAVRASGGEPSKRLRMLVYDRDRWVCQICGSGHDITLDHRIPVSKGGMTTEGNLQVLCRPCNSSKRDLCPQLEAM